MYLLRKRANRELYEFTFSEGKKGKLRALDILRRLIKKGLVEKVNRPGYNDYYFLTDEGKKVADEIVKEVDEHKSW